MCGCERQRVTLCVRVCLPRLCLFVHVGVVLYCCLSVRHHFSASRLLVAYWSNAGCICGPHIGRRPVTTPSGVAAYIGPSAIASRGRGLFPRNTVSPGTDLGEYRGKVSFVDDSSSENTEEGPYCLFWIDDSGVAQLIDGDPDLADSTSLSFINDPSPGEIANCQLLFYTDGRPHIVTTRQVDPTNEFLFCYGRHADRPWKRHSCTKSNCWLARSTVLQMMEHANKTNGGFLTCCADTFLTCLPFPLRTMCATSVCVCVCTCGCPCVSITRFDVSSCVYVFCVEMWVCVCVFMFITLAAPGKKDEPGKKKSAHPTASDARVSASAHGPTSSTSTELGDCFL